MSREEPSERTTSTGEEELSIISQGTQALAQLSERIAPRFKRAEVRKRVGRYLRGLLASVERKNGWQMAEELAEPNAHGVQRLLAEADWDEEAVRDDLRAYVIEHLGEAGGMLVVDETGFVKKGKQSAGVARQYSGTAGRRENSQVGVYLVYSSPKGAAFIDRALYLPEEWTSDRVRCRQAGIPDEVEFATKGELAKRMLARAFAADVPAEWVVGDTVYGYDELRIWLDEQKKNYVLAVPETHTVWVQGRQQPVGLLAALLPAESWVVLSAGEGSKGPRLYEWAWLQWPDETDGPQERARFLLIRRSLADPDKRAYYRVAGPAQTTLPEVVRVAGSRWKIEEGYEQAKGEVGLDQYEVRTWRAWYRYMTLALLAYAALVVMQGQARTLEKKGEEPRSGLN
jgi:SRSO17 transposase